MKELSIEEKTNDSNYKAYTELINRLEDVKDAIKKQNYGIAMDILYKPYPEFQITTSTELKENEDEKIRKQITGFITYSRVLDETKKNWLAWLEKQDEQKPADKVEPKFKVGDWVIDKQGIMHQIANVIENVTNHTYAYDIVGGGYFNDNTECVRLWTIEDAKDGDVLSYRNGQWIFILKRRIDKDSFEYYTLWSTIHNDLTINDSAFSLLINSIYPTTKEQRDLLFQKIHEAGYEWDSEKKELKKEEEVYNLHNYLYDKQSPVWSKEDKDYYDAIITKLEVTQEDATLTDNQMNFLKSLKERYTWKPSDEQMDAIKDAIDYLGENTKIVRKHLMSLHEQLKKLREE